MKKQGNGAYHGGAGWQALISDPSSYEGVVCADVNDSFYPPAPKVVETLQSWASRANFGADAQCIRLRTKLSSMSGVPVEQIHVGCGSSELLQSLIFSLVGANDNVVTLDPTYSEYVRCVEYRGGIVSRLELEESSEFACDVRKLAKLCSGSKMVVICNPNNPTGQVISRFEVLEFLRTVDSNVIVVVDEAYIDYALTESVIRDVTSAPNLVVVRTFSKAYALSGLRVGYAALGSGVNETFKDVVRPPRSVGLLAGRAAEAALDEYGYVEEMVAETLRVKRDLIARLSEFKRLTVFESRTGYFMAKLRANGITSAHLTTALGRKGVFLRDCAPFGSSVGNSFLRINTQSATHNSRIVDAIRQLLSEG